jgi:hypothetical protein
MTPATIDRSITDTIRSAAFAYVETTIPPGMTIGDYRRAEGERTLASHRRRPGRYPDDPVGDYETTEGGW